MTATEPVELDVAVADGVVGVDPSADHLAVHVLDRDGNPVGSPHRIPIELTSLPSTTRDARVRDAITRLLDIASSRGVTAVAVEDLGFAQQESSREKFGRNKTFRRTIAHFPTTKFRERLVPIAARRGICVIAVDPRYTSVVGGRDWTPRLSSTHRPVTRHDGAAVTIGRRGLLLPLRAHTRAAVVRSVPTRGMEET